MHPQVQPGVRGISINARFLTDRQTDRQRTVTGVYAGAGAPTYRLPSSVQRGTAGSEHHWHPDLTF